MSIPIQTAYKQGNKSTSTNHFKLHHHSFSNIIFNMSSNLHRAHLKSCAKPSTRVWLYIHFIIPCFQLPSNVFFSILQTKLTSSILCLLVWHIASMDSHWTPWGFTSFIACMVGKGLHPMMLFEMLLYSLRKMQVFTYCENKLMFFYCLFFNLFIDKLTLFY